MSKIFVHADDYGVSVNNSLKYINLLNQGKLDSISIIPNSQYFDKCATLLTEALPTFPKRLLYSVHINLVDGLSISSDTLPLLQDSNHCIKTSWGKLFFISFFSFSQRKDYKKQLKSEIYAQIQKVINTYNFQEPLRIDSHMHTHMIPIVSESICELIQENNLPIEFVRVTKEPLQLFFQEPKLLFTYPIINYIKNILLNLLTPQLERKLKLLNIPSSYLLGVMMSGNMNQELVPLVAKHFIRYSSNKNRSLEILFHPGKMETVELGFTQNKEDINAFYLSPNRDIEYNSVIFNYDNIHNSKFNL